MNLLLPDTIWLWGLFLLGLFLSVSIHELAHAWAFAHLNVRLQRISIFGLPVPFRSHWCIKLPIKCPRFPDASWEINPIPLGAFVRPHPDDINSLTPNDLRTILVYGPLANLIVAAILFAAACVLDYSFFHTGVIVRIVENSTEVMNLTTGEMEHFAWQAPSRSDFTLKIFNTIQFLLILILARRLSWFPLLAVVFATLTVIALFILGSHALWSIMVSEIERGRLMVDNFLIQNDTFEEMLQTDNTSVVIGMLCELTGMNVMLAFVNLVPFISGDGSLILATYIPERQIKTYVITVGICIIVGCVVYPLYESAHWMFLQLTRK